MPMDPILARHEIVSSVGNLLETLGRPELLKLRNSLEPEQRAGLDRAEIFTRQIKERLENTSSAELSINLLGGVHAGLVHTNNEINSFISNSNAGHVSNAIGNLDSAITSASQAFFRNPVKGSKVYEESLSAVQNAAQKITGSLEAGAARLEGKLSELESTVAGQATENEQLRADLKQAIQDARSEIETTRDKSGEIAGDLVSKYELLNSQLSEKYASSIAEKEREIGDYVVRLNVIESEAKKILQIIGNIGVTGNYQKRADDEFTSANIWRFIALGFFMLGVSVAVFSLYKNISGTIDLTTLLIRFTMAVTISIPAIYAARESARHRSNSDRARQTELELASLGPFLQTLPEAERERLISQLAPEYFGRDVSEHKVEALFTASELGELLSKAAPGK